MSDSLERMRSRLSDIEDAIAAGKMDAPMVFTKMKELLSLTQSASAATQQQPDGESRWEEIQDLSRRVAANTADSIEAASLIYEGCRDRGQSAEEAMQCVDRWRRLVPSEIYATTATVDVAGYQAMCEDRERYRLELLGTNRFPENWPEMSAAYMRAWQDGQKRLVVTPSASATINRGDHADPAKGGSSRGDPRPSTEIIEELEREVAALRLLEGMDALECSALGTFLKGGDIPATIDAARGSLVRRMLEAERRSTPSHARPDSQSATSYTDWQEIDRLDAFGTFGGRVVPYNGVWKIYLNETNCELWSFKTREEAEAKMADAIKKSGYSDAENPLMRSATGWVEAEKAKADAYEDAARICEEMSYPPEGQERWHGTEEWAAIKLEDAAKAIRRLAKRALSLP